MTLGSIPSTSVVDYANTFEFSDKNCLNSVFSCGSRFDPIWRVRSGIAGHTEGLKLLLNFIIGVSRLGR